MKIYNEILTEESICFDIGANSGNKALEMLEIAKMVICIEPQPDCCNTLRCRLPKEKSIIINAACSSSSSKMNMKISQYSTLSTMSDDFIAETSKNRFRGVSWDKTIEVNTITLDSIIKKYGVPDFCKIDVEGYEDTVLSGLSTPIPIISIEFTPELKNKSFLCIDRLLSLSDSYLFNYSEGETGTFYFKEWLCPSEMISFLKSRNDFIVSFGDIYARR